jgi:S1-C subfamily serine protease
MDEKRKLAAQNGNNVVVPPAVDPSIVPVAPSPIGPAGLPEGTVSPMGGEVEQEEQPAEQAGVRILAVEAGGAAERAGLRAGDVILSFGGRRTPTFAALQAAVQRAEGPVKVIYINGENGQTEYRTVEPDDGRIGVTCE